MAQTAFSAGGRRAASCSELKPEYDVPYMPTLPFDHGWSASQAMTSARSDCSSGGYSSVAMPAGRPRAPHVDPGDGEAALVGQPHVLAPVGDGQVVLAVRERLEDDGPRPVAVGEHERGGQAHPVGHLDPDLVLAHPGHL